jgi:hypothetical protein
MTALSSPFVVGTTAEQELTELAISVVVAAENQAYLAIFDLEVANGASRNIDVTFRLTIDGAPEGPTQTINIEPGTHMLQASSTRLGLTVATHTWRALVTVNVNSGAVYGMRTALFVSTLPVLLSAGGGVDANGDLAVRRLQPTLGTPLGASDFVLSAGWGTTASVGAISGTDQRWRATFTAAGTGQSFNPTITLTYRDGSWGSAPIPALTRVGGTGSALIGFLPASSPTVLTITAEGTPLAGETYILTCNN